jgi:hypothetical protein
LLGAVNHVVAIRGRKQGVEVDLATGEAVIG